MRALVLFLSAVLALAAAPAAIVAQDAPKAPVPFSEQALLGQLMGIQFGSRENPDLAFTHDQAQKLLPLVKKFKDNPNLTPADTKDLWNKAQVILTDEQRAFAPERPTRQGNGNSQGNGNNQNLTPQERLAKMLDRLIQRLEKI